jgi:hypothetical protein
MKMWNGSLELCVCMTRSQTDMSACVSNNFPALHLYNIDSYYSDLPPEPTTLSFM